MGQAKTLTGRRAMMRDLIAMGVKSPGARRRIVRQLLAAKKADRMKDYRPDPLRRPPIAVKVRDKRAFAPGSIGRLNAKMVAARRVARQINEMGKYEAARTGFGDKKQRRMFKNGIARTGTCSKSWNLFYKLYSPAAVAQRGAEEKAEARRASTNPLKRGYQWLKDRATRGR